MDELELQDLLEPKNLTILSLDNINDVDLHPNLKEFVTLRLQHNPESTKDRIGVDGSGVIWSKAPELMGGYWNPFRVNPDLLEMDFIRNFIKNRNKELE